MISFYNYALKVLSEYPEAKMTVEQQTSSLEERFEELVKKLDDGTPHFPVTIFLIFYL